MRTREQYTDALASRKPHFRVIFAALPPHDVRAAKKSRPHMREGGDDSLDSGTPLPVKGLVVGLTRKDEPKDTEKGEKDLDPADLIGGDAEPHLDE